MKRLTSDSIHAAIFSLSERGARLSRKALILLLASAASAPAQLLDYLGPGVLTRGASTIGQRSGRDLDLRFFGNVTGVYDTGLQPISVTQQGTLTQVGGLYGVEAGIGAYGRHTWRRSVLGLDYSGNYRHYPNNQFYNGSNHTLGIGYTLQQSRRIIFDFQAAAGSASFGANFINQLPQGVDSIVDQTTLLFDNRTNYLQGGMNTSILLTPRTSVTMGGSTYTVRRQSNQLVGVNGYTLNGGLQRRLSQVTTIGFGYQRIHYDFPRAFGESNIDVFQGVFARQLGRFWTVSLAGGVYRSEVQGLQRVAVDPAIAALLGITSTVQTFYRKNIVPQGRLGISRTFRYAQLTLGYSRSVNPGNGVFLTSRQESISSSISYTGLRTWSVSLSGGRDSMSALGQDLQRFEQYSGGLNLGYRITPVLNLGGSFFVRHQTLGAAFFRGTSTRTAITLTFSPGEIPISFR